MLHLFQLYGKLKKELKENAMATSHDALVPTEKDVAMAQESSRLLGSLDLEKRETVGIQIEGKKVSVPGPIAQMLLRALNIIAKGKSVSLMPLEEEVSPQEAAELLNVSRPFAARLFDEGAIPSRKVGTHRRAFTDDVLAYRQRTKEARLKVLDELAAEGQRLDRGY
jgi:excisionase family DNA binding protein